MDKETKDAIQLMASARDVERKIKSGELDVDSIEFVLQILFAKLATAYGADPEADPEDARFGQICSKTTEICDILREIDMERKQSQL